MAIHLQRHTLFTPQQQLQLRNKPAQEEENKCTAEEQVVHLMVVPSTEVESVEE